MSQESHKRARDSDTAAQMAEILEYASTCILPTTFIDLPLVAKREYNHDSTIYTRPPQDSHRACDSRQGQRPDSSSGHPPFQGCDHQVEARQGPQGTPGAQEPGQVKGQVRLRTNTNQVTMDTARAAFGLGQV